MRFNKKSIAILTLASILMFSLVGCGSKASTSTSTSKGVVNLTMWVHETDSPEGKLYKKRVADFNEVNKGKISVKLTAIPRTGTASGYDDKVNAAVTTNSLPDVLTCDGPTVAAEAEAGILAPIDDYVKKSDLTDFNPDIIKQGTYNEKLYGLGAMDSSVVIYYNKDMFAAAGITAPTDLKSAWTWDQLQSNAKKLTTSKVFGINMSLNSGGEWNTYAFLPFVQSNGGQIISNDGKTSTGYINSAKTVEAVGYIKKLVDDKVVSKTPIDNSFELGKAAMTLTGTWEQATLAKYPNVKYGIMPYPVSNSNAKAVSPCGSWGFYMTKSATSDKQKAAVDLIKYMTNTESCVDIYKANGMPPARKTAVAKITEFKSLPLKVVADQLQKTATPRPATADYPVLSDGFSKAIANAISGQDPKVALDAAAKQIDAQLGN
ncbi:ABC transporter substrate-binding protein [Clostridium estertheticum]|uniref:sugar ABC transporter substrate-binding protein n=1 Tax=Clostridium estertheticum TaxID=238834 RepID=UPI001CF265FE|nr:sugar ABC transporter substrate-binding protein [Clostridium estertheticum]MCB2359963.1 sugar ABC transporter substrate-binding protein [Clostridium estertheticum]